MELHPANWIRLDRGRLPFVAKIDDSWLSNRQREDMRISGVTIKNFKAIQETRIPLTDFTVLVGTNGSGKSSVLQALHWMLQSGRNNKVSPARVGQASTLSELDATYMPSPEYKNSSHSAEYGNFSASPKMDVLVDVDVPNEDGSTVSLSVPMWIRSARNEGVSVHIPSANSFVSIIRGAREISAYIPGLAGIPLQEEKRSMRIVERQAAAGDANTVLRNVLDLLKAVTLEGDHNGLEEVQRLASNVLGEMSISVSFEEKKDFKIQATFQTKAMKDADTRRFKPLELAGIGFLQVIQIFAYLVYFRPRLLLVDEPDSHLHPDMQERLVAELMNAAKDYDSQVILTTHSPSVVRSLGSDANLVWMRDGEMVSDKTDEIRRDMGWGLLDKSILLITEDKKVSMLNRILSQWPDLNRRTVVWPMSGNTSLPNSASLVALKSLLGDHMKIVLHRDSDFMVRSERESFSKEYEDKGIPVWLTRGSDVEAYWACPSILAVLLEIEEVKAKEIIDKACDLKDSQNADRDFRNKRKEIYNRIPAYKNGDADQVGADTARDELSAVDRTHIYIGKDLISSIRAVCSQEGIKGGTRICKDIPDKTTVADDLREILKNA
ncbi:MAG: AAA family ATPase [Verrucomicrobia bacterium]|jgi:ABC-type cobalamin/Fe3+-siderophores transport system ATPase subunit|nr:AAA family ATPase [Verrucomicrobiota bacterium]